jgi:hypothetical protein
MTCTIGDFAIMSTVDSMCVSLALKQVDMEGSCSLEELYQHFLVAAKTYASPLLVSHVLTNKTLYMNNFETQLKEAFAQDDQYAYLATEGVITIRKQKIC